VLVEDVVVLDVCTHRKRGGALAPVQEYGSAGHPQQRRPLIVQSVDERAQRPLVVLTLPGHQRAAALPCSKHREDRDADQLRNPRAVGQLGQVRGEEQDLHHEEGAPPSRRTQSGLPHC
jgi:hypothetical protein